MRIVSGCLRGRIIPSHRSLGGIRLTASHLKEAVFSMLGPSVDGLAFLDLCAGSGQMGMEAYSRGARVMLNEPDPRRRAQIRALLRTWQVMDVDVRGVSAQKLIPLLMVARQRFDLVYVDPPYQAVQDRRPLSQHLLEQLSAGEVLQNNALVLIQHQAGLLLPERVGTLAQLRQRTYGNTELRIFRQH